MMRFQNSRRPKSAAIAFLISATVFLWGCLYIPKAQFRWTVLLGEGEYGLCKVKGTTFFIFGTSTLFVPSPVAAATVALAVGLSVFALMLAANKLSSRIDKRAKRVP